MKSNFIHVCFIIDESGSMSGSEADVVGGFNKTIQEQRDVKDGQCVVSLFSFNSKVTERFIGKDVNELKLSPCACIEVELPHTLPDWFVATI